MMVVVVAVSPMTIRFRGVAVIVMAVVVPSLSAITCQIALTAGMQITGIAGIISIIRPVLRNILHGRWWWRSTKPRWLQHSSGSRMMRFNGR